MSDHVHDCRRCHGYWTCDGPCDADQNALCRECLAESYTRLLGLVVEVRYFLRALLDRCEPWEESMAETGEGGPLDLNTLESLARAATPGPWCAGNGEHWGREVRSPGRVGVAWCGGDRGLADAAYIAAVSPDVVLALIARVRELERKRDEASLFDAAANAR